MARIPNVGRLLIAAIVGFNKNSLEMVKLLVQHGVDVHKVFTNELNGKLMNAFGEAVNWDNDDVADYLRSQGCVLPPTGATVNARQSLDDEIVAYFEQHMGPVRPQKLIEIVPTEPRIVVHVIAAAAGRDHVTLFTAGMSSHAMAAAPGERDFQYAEIFMQLPSDWKYSEMHNPAYGWPVAWLRSIAQYPYQNNTGLGGPVTVIANGDPPQPLAPGVPFTSLLLLAESRLTSQDGRLIQVYRMTPLYTEERDLERREGAAALMRAFDRHGVSFVVDLHRPNVAL